MSIMINLRDLVTKKDPVVIQLSLSVTDLVSNHKEILDITPLEVDLQVKMDFEVARVWGIGKGQIRYVCSRCLKEYNKTLQINIQEALTQNSEIAKSDPEESIQLVTSDEVDIEPYIRESFLLELPYAPICEESCEGLCPICGVNKNESSCTCKQDQIDPRLAKLKDFYVE
ncbi:YceD family protein [Chengkuizengella sp. SCS-71B]|uniref:YceD family protein n=1 Tax=Chengkuizengella sp. SCS-71B TaxID=3115290 RepID=UPI0032C247D6